MFLQPPFIDKYTKLWVIMPKADQPLAGVQNDQKEF